MTELIRWNIQLLKLTLAYNENFLKGLEGNKR